VGKGNAGYVFYPTPSKGEKSSAVTITGSGLPPNTDLQLLFGAVQLGHCTTSPEGTVNVQFYVPLVSPGFYYITAKNSDGIGVATTSFTVVNQPTVSPTLPTLSTSPTQTPHQSQYPPPSTNPSSYVNPAITWSPFSFSPGTPKPVESGISPLMIGIIVVAIIAVIVPVAFFIRSRSRPESTYDGASETPTAPAPVYPPRTPTAATAPRYGQTLTRGQYQSRSTMPSRPGMPSRYDQSSAVSTRMCPRCRQTISAGYSICPYCHKRLR
jgi:hypothetical protein